MSDANKKSGHWCTITLVAVLAGGCSGWKTNTSSGLTSSRAALTTANGLGQNGLWANGLWANGLWANGLWANGLWANGLWANGLWANGLWANGLWANGLWANGLWANGLWANGLWANGLTGDAAVPGNTLRNSPYARQLLQYIYSCAMPATTYDTTLDPNNGAEIPCSPADAGGGSSADAGVDGGTGCDVGYTCSPQGTCVIPLTGAIGVGINSDGSTWWGSGTCDESCQRWVSACVLARTNAYGVHVEISMRAPDDAPQAIKDALAVSDSEHSPCPAGSEADPTCGYTLREGAYYGNIFATTPVNPAPSPSYSGPATGRIASTPSFYACAGPESNIPEITKRFCSSQGDQVVIEVPGVCLGTATEAGACQSEGASDTMQDCYTSTATQPRGSCADYRDPSCYNEVITVYLKQPIAVCGNEVCEANEDDSALPSCTAPGVSGPCYCPSDCHPGTWAHNFAPNIANGFVAQSGYDYTDQYFRGEQLGMSAVGGPDNSIAVIGMAQGAVNLGGGSLSADPGFGILAKFDRDGQYVWGIRFGNTSLSATDGQLQELNAVAVAPNGNITVVGKAQETVGQVTYNNIWIRTYSPDGQLVHSTSSHEGLASSTSFLELSRSVGLDRLDNNVVIAGRYQGDPLLPMFVNSAVPLSFVAKISPNTPNNPVLWTYIPAPTFTPDTLNNPNLEEDVGHHTLSLDAADNVVVLDENEMLKLDPTGADYHAPGSTAPCVMGNIYFARAAEVVPWRMAVAVDPRDPDGSIYVTGYTLNQPNQTIQGEVIPAPPLLEKFDKNCVRQWTTTPTITCAFGCSLNPPNLHGLMIGFGPTGDVIVGAVGSPYPGGSIDFGAGLFPTYTSENIYLSAYSTEGVWSWAKQFPVILGNSLLSMSMSGEGRLVAGGTYSGSMQFDDRLLVTEKPEDRAVVDSFLASYTTPAADVTPPQIGAGNNDPSGTSFSTVPQPIFVQATGPAGATVFFMPPTAIDSGNAGTSVSCLPRPNTTFSIGTTTVTCTASDPRGNHSSAMFNVTVADTLGPVFSTAGDITVQATDPTGAVVPYAVTATDQVDGSRTVTCAPPSGSKLPVGQTTVVCTATDTRQNQSSTTFSVNVTPPPITVTCVGTPTSPAILSTSPGVCGATVNTSDAGSCSAGAGGGATCTFDGTSSETLGPGDHSVLVVGSLTGGSTASCTSYVRVADNEKPAVTCAGQTVQCTGNGGATVTPGASCTDNCSCTTSCATGLFPVGTSSGVCTATDPSGNSATCQPVITVVDSTPPVVTPLPGPSQLQCDVDRWTDPGAVALDVCVGDLSGSVQTSGTIDPTHVGSYTETYAAVDPSGNKGSATRTVGVVDTLPPTLTLNSSAATLQCGVDHYTEAAAKATDVCAGDLTSAVTESGTVNAGAVGPYTVTYTVTDPSGNTSSLNRSINVVDTLAPSTTATVGPNPVPNRYINIDITSYTVTPKGGGATITGTADCWTSAGLAVALKAADACALKQLTYTLTGVQTGSATVASGSATIDVTKNGSTTITYYATDKAGNAEATKTLPVFVGAGPGGQFGFSCAPSASLKNLPSHGTVTGKGTVSITNSKTGRTLSQSFSFTQTY